MAQWSCTAASLDRWLGPWRRSSPAPPCQAPVPAGVTPPRRAKRECRIGCASIPRELGAAAEAEAVQLVVGGDSEEEGDACDACGGAGWMICDFCKGKKNNVKSEGTRVYRRCPTCKAAGFILCPRCRVFKCITFPESNET